MGNIFKKVLFVLTATVLFAVGASAQEKQYSEAELSDMIFNLIGGQREVSMVDGRADLDTSEYAIEIEWADNWKESIGQALWYGLCHKKKPGIILLVKCPEDYVYFEHLKEALNYAGLTDSIEVGVFPKDLQFWMKEKQFDVRWDCD